MKTATIIMACVIGLALTGDAGAAVLCAKWSNGKMRMGQFCKANEGQVNLRLATTVQSSCAPITVGSGFYEATASCDGVGTLVGGGGDCVTVDAQGNVDNSVGAVASFAYGNAWYHDCDAKLDSRNLNNLLYDWLMNEFAYAPDFDDYNIDLKPTVCAYAVCATVSP